MKITKSSKSIVQKESQYNKTPNVLSKRILFIGEFNDFLTQIDLTNLTPPLEATSAGFSNPPPSEVPLLFLHKNSLKVYSTYKEELKEFVDYIIVNNYKLTLINNLTTEPGEVFFIELTIPNEADLSNLSANLSNAETWYNEALYGVKNLPTNISEYQPIILDILTKVSTSNRKRIQPYGFGNVGIATVGGFPGSGAYYGGVLLPDGRVFCVPANTTTARIYDPITNTVSVPSGSYPGSNAYFGGVLLPDGRVFCVPYNATTARIYDPVTNTLSTPSGTYPGSFAYLGGVLLPDGRVFCVPADATTARIYDPVTNTTSTPAGTYPGGGAYFGGVLLPDGRVFCVPHNATTARIYDPVTNTVSVPSGSYPGSLAYTGGVLLPDGRVFCIPRNATSARIYDPITDTLSTPSGSYPGSNAYVGGVLLPDGRVFCVPSHATTARIYDPVTNTLSTPAGTYPGSDAYAGGILLPDGRVFCVPTNATSASIISGFFSNPISTNYPMQVLLGPFLNKF